jgi:hypothetical protein
MTVFVSYSGKDADLPQFQLLLSDLSLMRRQIWLDERLAGGQTWWDEILRQIRDCDLFLFLLSKKSLKSEACRRELAYAASLQRPILAVRIGDLSTRELPEALTGTQMIDYSKRAEPGSGSVALLRDAVDELALTGVHPLPDPLPAPPDVPVSYLHDLQPLLEARELPLAKQEQFVQEVREHVDDEDEDRKSLAEALQLFRLRPDIAYHVTVEIDQLLRGLTGEEAPMSASVPPNGARDSRSRRRWLPWLPRRSRARSSGPAEPAEKPQKGRPPEPNEEVSFTAGYPGMVTPQLWYSLSIYVHLNRLQDEVDEHIADESRQFGLQPAVSKAAAFMPLPKGSRLRFTPELQGVAFNPPAQELRWLEDLQHVVFRMQATTDAAGRTVLGAVEVHAGPLLVAQVPLSIHVRGVGEREARAEATATSTTRLFRSVFASYAHEDDQVVNAITEAYRAVGIDVLVDKASLRAGEDWQKTLSRLIDEADLFELFWSEAASRSRYVSQEWQEALSLQDRKGERFIRPLYWKTPWPPPPAQLAHLHFAHLDLAALTGATGH